MASGRACQLNLVNTWGPIGARRLLRQHNDIELLLRLYILLTAPRAMGNVAKSGAVTDCETPIGSRSVPRRFRWRLLSKTAGLA